MEDRLSLREINNQLYNDIGQLEFVDASSWGSLRAYIAMTQNLIDGKTAIYNLDLKNYYNTSIRRDHENPVLAFNYVKGDLRDTVLHMGHYLDQ